MNAYERVDHKRYVFIREYVKYLVCIVGYSTLTMVGRTADDSRSQDLDIACWLEAVGNKLGWAHCREKGRGGKLDDGKESLHQSVASRLLDLEVIQVDGNIGGGDANGGEEAQAVLVLLVFARVDWIEGVFTWQISWGGGVWVEGDIFT